VLLRKGAPNYLWHCPEECLPVIDTGVPASEELDNLRRDEAGTMEHNGSHFFPPMTPSRIATAKVFMGHILCHFIQCGWATCYNALYFNVLVPHLDAPEVLDYVLQGGLVHDGPGVEVGKSGAKLYPELRSRLQRVASVRIRQYLADNFPAQVA
jgi:hypothetical protein